MLYCTILSYTVTLQQVAVRHSRGVICHVRPVSQGMPLLLDLPLPIVDLAHAHAVFDDQFSHANAAALSFPETHWRQLEGPFLAGLPLQLLPCNGFRDNTVTAETQSAFRNWLCWEVYTASTVMLYTQAHVLSIIVSRLLLHTVATAHVTC